MKYAEYCQQIKHLKMPLNEIIEKLKSAPIKMWALCVHDKDTYEDGSHKEDHLHIMMKFNSDQTPENVSKWFSDEPNRIEKNKHQFHAYENMCSYLVHETPTADGKYHYPDEEVIRNFDFHEFMEAIRQGVKEAQSRTKKHPIQDVLERICDDKIPRLKLDEHLSNMERIKYARDIEMAYRIRDERLGKMIDRNMTVVYMWGPAETGKTTFAKMLAKTQGMTCFVSGSSNDPLQGYIGQECIILDDIRGSDWKINDLLKFLDNNTNSLVKSRYSNKLMTECKMVILTSIMDIDDLYKTLKENENEPITQLKRRCATKIEFTKDTLLQFVYSPEMKDYKFVKKTPNPVPMINFFRSNNDVLDKIDNMVNAIKEESELPF